MSGWLLENLDEDMKILYQVPRYKYISSKTKMNEKLISPRAFAKKNIFQLFEP